MVHQAVGNLGHLLGQEAHLLVKVAAAVDRKAGLQAEVEPLHPAEVALEQPKAHPFRVQLGRAKVPIRPQHTAAVVDERRLFHPVNFSLVVQLEVMTEAQYMVEGRDYCP